MSFILDALKKLEQQKRQQESIPDLTTIHQIPEKIQKKKPLWPYILTSALVLNILIFVLNIPRVNKTHPEKDLIPSDTHQAPFHKEKIISPEDLKIKEDDIQTYPKSPDSTKAPVSLLSEKNQPPKDQTNIEPQIDTPYEFLPSGEELVKLKKKIQEEQLSIIHTSAGDREIEKFDHPETTVDVVDFDRLPPEVKAQLPDLKITGHIFSNNPDNRIININGGIFREGDRISENLILKEITLTGAIFDYKGILFLKKVY